MTSRFDQPFDHDPEDDTAGDGGVDVRCKDCGRPMRIDYADPWPTCRACIAAYVARIEALKAQRTDRGAA